MGVKILWFSRHELSSDQISGLKKKLGDDLDVTQVNKTIVSVKELGDLSTFDVLAVVAPIGLQAEFLSVAGDRPVIFAKNAREFDTEGKVSFRHTGWFRLVKVEVVTEEFSA